MKLTDGRFDAASACRATPSDPVLARRAAPSDPARISRSWGACVGPANQRTPGCCQGEALHWKSTCRTTPTDVVLACRATPSDQVQISRFHGVRAWRLRTDGRPVAAEAKCTDGRLDVAAVALRSIPTLRGARRDPLQVWSLVVSCPRGPTVQLLVQSSARAQHFRFEGATFGGSVKGGATVRPLGARDIPGIVLGMYARNCFAVTVCSEVPC